MREVVESADPGGQDGDMGCVGGESEPAPAVAAADLRRDGEQVEAEPFGFPGAGGAAGEGEDLHPGGEFGGEHDDRDPDLILREIGQG